MYSLDIKQLDADQVRQLLRENVLKVVFVKSSGEQRVMRCTTKPDHIPLKQTVSPAASPAVTAWDLDIAEWRSFRYERLVSVDVVDT